MSGHAFPGPEWWPAWREGAAAFSEALGDLVPLRLTHHAWAGRPSHCNFDWLLPRGCRVIGNVPPLLDRKSTNYAWGWRLGDQLAHQRRWDRDERASGHPGERSFVGAEIAGLVAADHCYPAISPIHAMRTD